MFQAVLTNSKTFFILIIISLLIFATDSYNFLNLPKSLIQQVTAPIQYGLYKSASSVTRQLQFVVLARRAAQENKALEEQLAQVLSENARLRKELSETQGFLEQQKSLDPQTFSLVAVRPLGVNRYLIIDKGLDDGLKVGQAVIYKENYIGSIKEVSPKRSQVLLVTDPDSHIGAFSSNPQGKAKGVLDGEFGSEMVMNKILHEELIEVGDLVYSEGTEVRIPRGLILGQVSEISSKDNEIFKSAKVKPVFDLSSLDVVFVVTN